MKKKINILLIVMAMTLILSGCAKKEVPMKTVKVDEPIEVVTEFIEAMKEFDIDEMTTKVKPDQRGELDKINSFQQGNKDESAEYLFDFMKGNAEKINYEVLDSNTEGDRASINVNFNYVDGTPLYKATIKEYIKKTVSLAVTGKKRTNEETFKLIVQIMKDKKDSVELPMVDKAVLIDCVKIDNEWYIEQLNEDIMDVASSNLLSYSKDIEDKFNVNLGNNAK